MSSSDQTQPVRVRTATAPSRGAATSRDQAGSTPRSTDAASTRPQQSRPAAGLSGAPSSSRSGGRTAPARGPVAATAGAPRRVRLTLSRVDPWSVMKLAFLLSVALGIALVVAAGVLWSVLDGMGVFDQVNGVVGEIMADNTFDLADYVGFGKVLSLSTVIAVVDVVLVTAIATLGAFLYNLAAALVGGLHVTLSDD